VATGTCYRCGQFDHFSKDYVGKGAAHKPLAPTRVYAFDPGELEGGSKVVIGTTPILGFEALVLFDAGATHSFVTIMFVRLSRLVERTLEPGLSITMVYKNVVCECLTSICGRVVTPRELINW
jgi:hypothetical protein